MGTSTGSMSQNSPEPAGPFATSRSVPLGTGCLIATCVGLTAYTALFLQDSRLFVICWHPVVVMGQVWRIATHHFAHLGVLHLLMNMLSTAALGTQLEGVCGTVGFSGLVAVLGFVQSMLYLTFCYVLRWLMNNTTWLEYCSAGLSGVLFAMLVLQLERVGD